MAYRGVNGGTLKYGISDATPATNNYLQWDGTGFAPAAGTTIGGIQTVTAYTVNTTLSSTSYGNIPTNEGATSTIELTLPTATAGANYQFVVQDTDGLKIITGSGDTCRMFDIPTKVAGYITSTSIGAECRLIAINATEWIATEVIGPWTIEIS